MSHRYRLGIYLLAAIACAGLFNLSTIAQAQEKTHVRTNSSAALEREVYHELVLMPFLTVFDNLQFQVTGTQVTLLGQVTQPIMKTEAEKAVKGIEGVESIVNNIEVLPALPGDVQIRRAEYRAIYGDPALERYALGSLQSIHIIVNGGHVTLEGSVDNAMDKQIAEARAKGVHSVFTVANNLKIQPHS